MSSAVRPLHRLPRRLAPFLALMWLMVAIVAGTSGCARTPEFASVGRSESNGQVIELYAPGGRLVAGKNLVRVRLSHATTEAPLDVPPTLVFVQMGRGSAPLRAEVPLTRAEAGAFDGRAVLDAQGVWWAELTFNGADGTQTMRVRVMVGK